VFWKGWGNDLLVNFISWTYIYIYIYVVLYIYIYIHIDYVTVDSLKCDTKMQEGCWNFVMSGASVLSYATCCMESMMVQY
jgi:hypothetical protein